MQFDVACLNAELLCLWAAVQYHRSAPASAILRSYAIASLFQSSSCPPRILSSFSDRFRNSAMLCCIPQQESECPDSVRYATLSNPVHSSSLSISFSTQSILYFRGMYSAELVECPVDVRHLAIDRTIRKDQSLSGSDGPQPTHHNCPDISSTRTLVNTALCSEINT